MGQIIGGDFAKFCSLLRIYELYNKIFMTTNRFTADMQNLTKTAAYSILPSFELGKNLAPYPCTNISGLCIRVFLHTKGNPF